MRDFMTQFYTILICLFIPILGFTDLATHHKGESISQEEEVSANEDLMREHGILNRLLLIYQEIAKRIEHNQDFPIDALIRSAKLIRNFLENYHEKLEEEFIFPRFEQANQLVDLVRTLKDQHQAGRQITDYIISHANEQILKDEEQRHILSHYLRLYIRMFRPHEAREDTVLFPAFRKLISSKEYEELGEKFEEREHQFFGKDGFDKTVNQVAEIEKELGIYNLSQFTPKLNRK